MDIYNAAVLLVAVGTGNSVSFLTLRCVLELQILLHHPCLENPEREREREGKKKVSGDARKHGYTILLKADQRLILPPKLVVLICASFCIYGDSSDILNLQSPAGRGILLSCSFLEASGDSPTPPHPQKASNWWDRIRNAGFKAKRTWFPVIPN